MSDREPPDPPHAALRERARAWFEELRDRLCVAFEAIEDEATRRRAAAGRFIRRRLEPARPKTARAARAAAA